MADIEAKKFEEAAKALSGIRNLPDDDFYTMSELRKVEYAIKG